jgi:hypothetical protein
MWVDMSKSSVRFEVTIKILTSIKLHHIDYWTFTDVSEEHMRPSSKSKSESSKLLVACFCLIFDPEDCDNMFI